MRKQVYAVMDDMKTTKAVEQYTPNDEVKELQDLLEHNYDLLLGDQMNPDEPPRRWMLIKREMPVQSPSEGGNSESLDFLFVDQDARLTLVECKLSKNPESRRRVIGQLLGYAANGPHYWDKGEMVRFAEHTAEKQGKTLKGACKDLLFDETDPEEFFDTVAENQQQQQIRLVFFLDEASNELKSVVQFLNDQMERTEVFLIEARQYAHGSTRLVVPTLFGFSERAWAVKKTVTVSGAKQKWDEKRFIEAENRAPAALRDFISKLRQLPSEFQGKVNVELAGGQSGGVILKKGRSSLVRIDLNGYFTFDCSTFSLDLKKAVVARYLEGLHKFFPGRIHDASFTEPPFSQEKAEPLLSLLRDVLREEFSGENVGS